MIFSHPRPPGLPVINNNNLLLLECGKHAEQKYYFSFTTFTYLGFPGIPIS